MTLDEAIEHSLEMFKLMGRQCGNKSHSCSLEHLQLANWLQELKKYREKYDNEFEMKPLTKTTQLCNGMKSH